MKKHKEIIELSEEILKNIELQEIPLNSIVLRCARLARITGNQSAMDLFKYELAGYPKDDNGCILPEAFNLARYTNRTFRKKDTKKEDVRDYLFPQTVSELENELDAAREQMKVAFDRNVSISSSNIYQHVQPPIGNNFERTNLRNIITETSKKIDQLRSGYYNYVLGIYYENKLKNITENIFQKKKIFTDETLSEHLPEAFKKFVSVYENLNSNNSEDWANSVHSCRRIIKDVADFLYPATNEEINIGKNKIIKMSDENYIQRLKQFIKIKSDSNSFKKLIGSNLEYIGDRIDSIYKSTTKGSHEKVTKEEAENYVIYTYMLISDILKFQKN